MGRIITLSFAVLATVAGTGIGLSESVSQDGVEAVQPARDLVRNDLSDRRTFAPAGYALPMRALPNPDAPARSQLDPGLHYVGP
jgi:CRISPR/Cas system-associated exonuclease Cas4 (RecB family)